MSEEVQGSAGRTFYKWDTQGQELMVCITDAPVLDRPNSFGGKDNFFLGTTEAGDKIQVPLPVDLKAKVLNVLDRINYGTTVFQITWVDSKKVKGKAPMKVFRVMADYLKPAAAKA